MTHRRHHWPSARRRPPTRVEEPQPARGGHRRSGHASTAVPGPDVKQLRRSAHRRLRPHKNSGRCPCSIYLCCSHSFCSVDARALPPSGTWSESGSTLTVSGAGSVRIAAGRNRFGSARRTTANNTTTATALPTSTGIGAAGKMPPTSMPTPKARNNAAAVSLDEPLGKVLARDRPDHDGERVGGNHAQCGADPHAHPVVVGGEGDRGEHRLVAELGQHERGHDREERGCGGALGAGGLVGGEAVTAQRPQPNKTNATPARMPIRWVGSAAPR